MKIEELDNGNLLIDGEEYEVLTVRDHEFDDTHTLDWFEDEEYKVRRLQGTYTCNQYWVKVDMKRRYTIERIQELVGESMAEIKEKRELHKFLEVMK